MSAASHLFRFRAREVLAIRDIQGPSKIARRSVNELPDCAAFRHAGATTHRKNVYYPVTTWGPAGQRVAGNKLLVKNNDVWFRRTVDACSGEGLQAVNGSATV
jgi:hypothetical protein